VDDQPSQTPATTEGTTSNPKFFAVSPTKLIVMSICTLGMYQLYWFYRNWCHVKRNEESEIQPILRAIFGMFFCYPLFKRIRDWARSHGIKKTFAAGPLTVGWIVLSLFSRLPAPFWLLGFFSMLFLIPAQKTANEINAITSPQHNPNRVFTKSDLAVVVIGGLVFMLAVIATFFPPRY